MYIYIIYGVYGLEKGSRNSLISSHWCRLLLVYRCYGYDLRVKKEIWFIVLKFVRFRSHWNCFFSYLLCIRNFMLKEKAITGVFLTRIMT